MLVKACIITFGSLQIPKLRISFITSSFKHPVLVKSHVRVYILVGSKVIHATIFSSLILSNLVQI
jgi:hypothetical protein